MRNRSLYNRSNTKSMNLEAHCCPSRRLRMPLKTTIKEFESGGTLSTKCMKRIEETPDQSLMISKESSYSPEKDRRGLIINNSKSSIANEVKIYKMMKSIPNFLFSSEEESPEEEVHEKDFQKLQNMFQEKAQINWKKISDFIFHQSKKELRSKLKIINQRLYNDQKRLSKMAARSKAISQNLGIDRTNIKVTNLTSNKNINDDGEVSSDFTPFAEPSNIPPVLNKYRKKKIKVRCTLQNLRPVLPAGRRHKIIVKNPAKIHLKKKSVRRYKKLHIKDRPISTIVHDKTLKPDSLLRRSLDPRCKNAQRIRNNNLTTNFHKRNLSMDECVDLRQSDNNISKMSKQEEIPQGISSCFEVQNESIQDISQGKIFGKSTNECWKREFQSTHSTNIFSRDLKNDCRPKAEPRARLRAPKSSKRSKRKPLKYLKSPMFSFSYNKQQKQKISQLKRVLQIQSMD
ncbi:unnamed protein product [Moneuplotes crassus]|uniref:Uncharacterized protein n=1 Tax=Euplotes crassus TaxID=5936 RepID=A0AAD1XA98_EUPCR|nr:unnamed protein product [Moneuplotes crassus]